VGIKEATADLNQISEVIRLCPDDFTVLSGDDFTSFATLAIGGQGVISVTSNVAPAEMSAMMEAGLAGDFAKGREIHYKLFPLMKAMFYDTNPVPAKTALALMGKIKAANPRQPLWDMNAAKRDELRKALTAFGLI